MILYEPVAENEILWENTSGFKTFIPGQALLIQPTPDSKPSTHTNLPYESRTRNLTWMDLVLAGILALGYTSFSDVQDMI